MSNQTMTFIDYVQQHERSWGGENYAGKPDLGQILQAKVVAFWEESGTKLKGKDGETRHMITLHDNLVAIEEFISRLVFRIGVQLPDKRLVKVFSSGKEVKIKGIKIVFE